MPSSFLQRTCSPIFEIGSGIDACRTQDRNLRPSINDGWEAGVKFSPLPWLNGREAYWEQRASGDVARVLQVKNVTNRKYVYAWYDSGSAGYSPADAGISQKYFLHGVHPNDAMAGSTSSSPKKCAAPVPFTKLFGESQC